VASERDREAQDGGDDSGNTAWTGRKRLDMAELGYGERLGFMIGARDEGRAAGVEPNAEEAGAAMAEAVA
jgi:hypothetical protein